MDIQHDAQAHKFYVVVDGQESALHYWASADVLDLQRTYVPVPLRHRGIAADIVRAALQYAKSQKLKVIPSCSYVRYFIDRHTEYTDLIK